MTLLSWRTRTALVFMLALIPVCAGASNTPNSAVFHDATTGASCGPAGGAGAPDPDLDRLKNRIAPVSATENHSVAELRNLPEHPKQPRALWSASDRATFGRYEGTPIHIVGYLVGVRPEGPEATNCGATDREGVDFHTWLVDSADQDKTFSAVVEVAPRWRQANPAWTVAALNALVEQGAQVRISGWPLYDQEHQPEVGKSRSTLWEIHPITSIEVATNGGWVDLGDNDAFKAIRNTAAMTAAAVPAAQQMFIATQQIIPNRTPPSARARQFGLLHLVHLRDPMVTTRIIQQERTLYQQESALKGAEP
jgi:hypothetical protein